MLASSSKLNKFCTRIIQLFLLFLFLLSEYKVSSTSTNRDNRRKISPPKPNETINDALYTLAFLLSILIIPLLIHFIWVISQDPATPYIVQDLTELLKQKAFGFLGDMGIKIKPSQSGKANPENTNKSV
jgi:hypothetical protein